MSYRSSSKANVSATTCTPAAPAGYVAGDVLVALATNNSATGVIAFPSGWTQVRSDSGAINDGLTASWGWTIATGTDSFSWHLTGTRDFGVIVAAYTGINVSSPIDISSVNGPVAAASSPVSTTGTGVTTAGLDDVIHLVSGAPSGGFSAGGSWAAPSAMTLRQSSPFTGTGGFAMGALSDFTQTSSGATGSQVGTWTDAGSTFGYIAYLVALTPAGGAATQAPFMPYGFQPTMAQIEDPRIARSALGRRRRWRAALEYSKRAA